MEADELKAIWKTHDSRLEKSLALNKRCITELQTQKSVSALAPLKRNRMLEIAFVLVIIFFLGLFIHENSSTWYYVLSASALILFLMIDIYGCIRQIRTIQELHYSDSVISIQKKLVNLEASLLNYIRFAFLCIPFYLVYITMTCKLIAGIDVVAGFTTSWWIANILFSLLLIPVSIWLYRKCSYTNKNNFWVQSLLENSGAHSIAKAMAFVSEIEEFKTEIDRDRC